MVGPEAWQANVSSLGALEGLFSTHISIIMTTIYHMWISHSVLRANLWVEVGQLHPGQREQWGTVGEGKRNPTLLCVFLQMTAHLTTRLHATCSDDTMIQKHKLQLRYKTCQENRMIHCPWIQVKCTLQEKLRYKLNKSLQLVHYDQNMGRRYSRVQRNNEYVNYVNGRKIPCQSWWFWKYKDAKSQEKLGEILTGSTLWWDSRKYFSGILKAESRIGGEGLQVKSFFSRNLCIKVSVEEDFDKEALMPGLLEVFCAKE